MWTFEGNTIRKSDLTGAPFTSGPYLLCPMLCNVSLSHRFQNCFFLKKSLEGLAGTVAFATKYSEGNWNQLVLTLWKTPPPSFSLPNFLGPWQMHTKGFLVHCFFDSLRKEYRVAGETRQKRKKRSKKEDPDFPKIRSFSSLEFSSGTRMRTL